MSNRAFKVELAVLAIDESHRVCFGVTKQYDPAGTEMYVLRYLLSEKTDDEFLDRLRAEVLVRTENNSGAQSLTISGLSSSQMDYLQGPINSCAQQLAEQAGGKELLARLDKLIEEILLR